MRLCGSPLRCRDPAGPWDDETSQSKYNVISLFGRRLSGWHVCSGQSMLWGAQESAMCACGHITQSVQHVVDDGMIHKALVALLVFDAQLQQLGHGWKT